MLLVINTGAVFRKTENKKAVRQNDQRLFEIMDNN